MLTCYAHPLSLLIHNLSQVVCVRLVASCDVTPCDLAEGNRYLPSYQRQIDLRNVEVASHIIQHISRGNTGCGRKTWRFSKWNNTMRFHLFIYTLLSLEKSVHAILSFEKYVTQIPSTISQTLFQSYSKIFHHPTSHLLRDHRDFFLYAFL
jgi:hypothetical protein